MEAEVCVVFRKPQLLPDVRSMKFLSRAIDSNRPCLALSPLLFRFDLSIPSRIVLFIFVYYCTLYKVNQKKFYFEEMSYQFSSLKNLIISSFLKKFLYAQMKKFNAIKKRGYTAV